MTGIVCVGIGVLVLVVWLWFSYRRASNLDCESEELLFDKSGLEKRFPERNCAGDEGTKEMKRIAAILLLLSVTATWAQPSYWWTQIQRKPDAKQSQEFWFVPGQGIFFTYASNHVIISASGGGGIAQTNIAAINLIGLAPGTNVTFTTNSGVLSINSSGGGGGGSGLTTNLNLYFADGTLNALVFSNGSLVNIVFPVSPQVAAWNSRVVAHGGASTSDNTQLALTTFLHSLTNASLDTKMLTVNPVVPDNLIASLTPLIVGTSSDPWANHNFVSGDLTVNGLAGDGSTKYAETGVAANVFASANSAGCTVYYYNYVNEAAAEMATVDGSADQFGLYLYSGVIYFDCFRTTAGQEISAALTSPGYVSGNRISATSFDIYFSNSGTAHASLIHGAANPTAMPTTALYAWAFNGNGTPSLYTTKRLSFLAIHNGLTATDSLAFFNAIQALRVSLGGGSI